MKVGVVNVSLVLEEGFIHRSELGLRIRSRRLNGEVDISIYCHSEVSQSRPRGSHIRVDLVSFVARNPRSDVRPEAGPVSIWRGLAELLPIIAPHRLAVHTVRGTESRNSGDLRQFEKPPIDPLVIDTP